MSYPTPLPPQVYRYRRYM